MLGKNEEDKKLENAGGANENMKSSIRIACEARQEKQRLREQEQREIGRQEEREETTKRLILHGLKMSEIAEIQGVLIETVEKLKKNIED